MAGPWYPRSEVAAGGRGHPTEDRDHQCLFLLRQSFSLSMGCAGGCSALFVTWPDLFALVWLWLFFFLGQHCYFLVLTAGLVIRDGNSCSSNSHFNLEITRVRGICNLCAVSSFGN